MKWLKIQSEIEKKLLTFWYRPSKWTYLFAPFSWLFRFLTFFRYIWMVKINQPAQFPIPIIIVGNISVGGTGKTPFVAWLVQYLIAQGYRPGIVMRGFKGKNKHPLRVTQQSKAAEVGDEALLLSQKCQCPLVIGKHRKEAVKTLLAYAKVDMIICDDGLQHYALGRDLEIVMIDGERRLGNGFCLPVGPLREAPSRLKKVDFIISNGKARPNEWEMHTELEAKAYPLSSPSEKVDLQIYSGKAVHAVAGIGNASRFFAMLRAKGILLIEHPFRDHHAFQQSDLDFQDNLPILMTEKDAVKCKAFLMENIYVVPLMLMLPETLGPLILRRILHGQKIIRHIGMPHLQAITTLSKREK